MKTSKEIKKYNINLRKRALLGVIDILILHWTRKQPLCGQDIMDRIKEEFSLYVGPGTLYPILYQLQYKGLIKVKPYHNKKMYFLTQKGRNISTKARKDYFKTQKVILNFLKQ